MTHFRLHVATLSNDPTVYARMRESMAEAGFTEEVCRFTLFDNSVENRFEPYAVLRDLLLDGGEPYIMLCHNDLIFSQATSYKILVARLNELNVTDQRWALAGDAGANRRAKLIMHLDDPTGSYRQPDLPVRAMSLDENLLIMRRDRYVLPTPGLSGFHFYGTDLCLNATLQRKRAYVIDFPVQHLSPGNRFSEAFERARQDMMHAWRSKLLIGLVRSTSGHFRVSRWPWLERLLQNVWIGSLLRRLRLSIVPAPGAMIKQR